MERLIIILIVRLLKKISLYKMGQFPEPYTRSKNKIKVELDFSYYATKSDLKSATGVDTSKCTKEADLASIKSDIDDLDIDKLKIVPVDLHKLSNVVEKEVAKKDMYDELVKKG